MENDDDYSWRSMTPQDIPLVCETFRAGSPQVSEENLEKLSQFPDERLAADTLVAIAPDGGIAAAGITVIFPSDENSLMGWLEGVVHTDHLQGSFYRMLCRRHILMLWWIEGPEVNCSILVPGVSAWMLRETWVHLVQILMSFA